MLLFFGTGVSSNGAASITGSASGSETVDGMSPRLITKPGSFTACVSGSCILSSSIGSMVNSFTFGDFFAIVVSKETPSTCFSLRFPDLDCFGCASLIFLRSCACSRLRSASFLALSYALPPWAFTPFRADFPVMITRQMIIRITSTTYVPAIPMAGTRTSTRIFPSIPPFSSTSCRKVQTRTIKIRHVATFIYA